MPSVPLLWSDALLNLATASHSWHIQLCIWTCLKIPSWNENTLWLPLKYCPHLHFLFINSQSTEALVFSPGCTLGPPGEILKNPNSLNWTTDQLHQNGEVGQASFFLKQWCSWGWERPCQNLVAILITIKVVFAGFTSDFPLSKFSPLVDGYDFILYNHFLFGILPVLTLLSWFFPPLLCFFSLHRWADWLVGQSQHRLNVPFFTSNTSVNTYVLMSSFAIPPNALT